MMIEARINSLKTLCSLLTDVKDPLDTLHLLVPMSHILGEVPHIMCNSRTRKPLNEQYMNLLQCMAQIIQNCRSQMFSMVGKNEEKTDESSNSKNVENAEQVIAYNAETNYARVMLISLHIVSLLYRRVDVQVILQSGIFLSIADSARMFMDHACKKETHLDLDSAAISSLQAVEKMPEVELFPYVELSSTNGVHTRDTSVLFKSDGYWQSDGMLPHWLQLTLPHGILLKELSILLISPDEACNVNAQLGSRIDHSYCPRVVSVYVGKSRRNLQQIRSLDMGISHEWIELLTAKDVANCSNSSFGEISTIRIEIAHNHMSGQNSRIAQIRIKAAVPGGDDDFQTFLMPHLELFTTIAHRITLNHISREFDYIHDGSEASSVALSYIKDPWVLNMDGNRVRSRIKVGPSIVGDNQVSNAINSILPLLQSSTSRLIVKYLSIPENLLHIFEILWGDNKDSILASAQLLITGLNEEKPAYWNGVLQEYMQQQINKDTKVTHCQRKSCALNHNANTVIEYFLNKIAASNYYTVIQDRKSEAQDVSVSESIYILRCLGDNESWAKEISEHCVKVIKRVNENLTNGFVYIDGFEVDIRKALSVILVLGGYVESTRVGGHVVLIDSMQNRRSAPAIDVNLSLKEVKQAKSIFAWSG